MNRRISRLSRELGLPPAPPPFDLDKKLICRQVHDILVTQEHERKAYMRHKMKLAAVLVCATLALAGTALAVAANMDVLQAYFDGDTSSAAGLVDREARSVSDKNFTFTVDSSVSDGENAFLLVRIDALSEEGRAKLNSDDWNGIDLFNIYPLVEDEETGELVHPSASNTSYGEVKEARTESSRSYTVNPRVASSQDGRRAVAVYARMGYMEKGLSIEVPLEAVEMKTITVNATGEAVLNSGPVTLETVEVSPFTIRLNFTCQSRDSDDYPAIPLLFRMKDGTLRGFADMTEEGGQTWNMRDDEDTSPYLVRRFREVMDLNQLSGIVVWGKEYPLNSGAPRDAEVDSHLLPFTLPVTPSLGGNTSASLPVRAFCEGIGAACDWDNATRSATIRYQDTVIVLTWGSETAMVNGAAVQMGSAPDVFGGKLCVSSDLYLMLNMEGRVTGEHWVIVP